MGDTQFELFVSLRIPNFHLGEWKMVLVDLFADIDPRKLRSKFEAFLLKFMLKRWFAKSIEFVAQPGFMFEQGLRATTRLHQEILQHFNQFQSLMVTKIQKLHISIISHDLVLFL